MSYLSHVESKLRYDPPIRIALDCLSKLGIYIYPYYLFVEGSLAQPMANPRTQLAEYELALLKSQDMKAIADFPARPVSENELFQRLEQGMICLGIKYHGKPVAFTWYNTRECHSSLCRFSLTDDEAYLFDAYTSMPHRGKGLAPHLRYQLYKRLATQGRRRLYSISNRYNMSSIRFKKKLNAVIVHSGLSLKLLNKWHSVSGLSEEQLKSIREAH